MHRCRDFGMEKSEIPGDGVVCGAGHDRRAARLRLRAGLHRVRRLALRDERGEDLQGHGPGRAERRADHRPERLGRRPDPGGRRFARRVLEGLPAQHARIGSGPADLRDPRAVRGRRGLFAGDHGLRLHDREDVLPLRDRSRRHQDRDARGGDEGGARRRPHALVGLGRRALRPPGRRRGSRRDPRAAVVPAVEQPGRPAASRRLATRPATRRS